MREPQPGLESIVREERASSRRSLRHFVEPCNLGRRSCRCENRWLARGHDSSSCFSYDVRSERKVEGDARKPRDLSIAVAPKPVAPLGVRDLNVWRIACVAPATRGLTTAPDRPSLARTDLEVTAELADHYDPRLHAGSPA